MRGCEPRLRRLVISTGTKVAETTGLFFTGKEAKWFDASDAELAATGWGFATPKLDDVQWAQAMRAATGFCQGKGFDGGFMNGHQLPKQVWCCLPESLGRCSGIKFSLRACRPSLPSEPVPAATRASRYDATLRFTDDTCPFKDYRETRRAEITPFSNQDFFYRCRHSALLKARLRSEVPQMSQRKGVTFGTQVQSE